MFAYDRSFGWLASSFIPARCVLQWHSTSSACATCATIAQSAVCGIHELSATIWTKAGRKSIGMAVQCSVPFIDSISKQSIYNTTTQSCALCYAARVCVCDFPPFGIGGCERNDRIKFSRGWCSFASVRTLCTLKL